MAQLSFLPPRWIMGCATLAGLGYRGKMPGTYGSFVGLIYYTLFFHTLPLPTYCLGCLLSTYLSCLICTQAENLLAQKDPPCVILDEMVAIPFCFIGLQDTMRYFPVWWFMALGFLLFRLLDILKPFGIKKIQLLNGGPGVVLDDVAAALLTCAGLHLGVFWLL